MLSQEHLAEVLREGLYCSSKEEAFVLAEIILGDVPSSLDNSNNNCNNGGSTEDHAAFIECLIEHLGIDSSQAEILVARLYGNEPTPENPTDDDNEEEEEDDDDDDENSSGALEDDFSETEDGDEMLLGEGDCELCDRHIKLTRHHLIPRSTWPRLLKILMSAALAKENGDMDKAITKLGPGLEDRLGLIAPDRSCIKEILQTTCDICRACHNAVHRTHSNMDLALSYNSIDKLLGDEQIAKFCKWASKQRPRGKEP